MRQADQESSFRGAGYLNDLGKRDGASVAPAGHGPSQRCAWLTQEAGSASGLGAMARWKIQHGIARDARRRAAGPICLAGADQSAAGPRQASPCGAASPKTGYCPQSLSQESAAPGGRGNPIYPAGHRRICCWRICRHSIPRHCVRS